MKKIKSYICPACNEKQDTITSWEDCSVGWDYDLEMESYEQRDIESGDFEAYACPSCGNDLPDKLAKKIMKNHNL